MFVCLSVFMFVCPASCSLARPHVRLSVSMFTCSSLCVSFRPHVCLSVLMFVCPFVLILMCQSSYSVYPSLFSSDRHYIVLLSVCPSLCLYVRPHTRMTVFMFVCPSSCSSVRSHAAESSYLTALRHRRKYPDCSSVRPNVCLSVLRLVCPTLYVRIYFIYLFPPIDINYSYIKYNEIRIKSMI